jgi:hypothetical protein
MYADTLNMVSTGIGNLIDVGRFDASQSPSAVRARNNNEVSARAMAPAMSLPWKFKGAGWTAKNPVAGDDASPSDIAAEWTRVKQLNEVIPDFSQRGGFAYAGSSVLTLTADDVRELFEKTATSYATILKGYYPNWDEWPADAQFAALSMAWGMGPNFPSFYPSFSRAVRNLDFDTAAEESFFKYVQGGTKEERLNRNADNEHAFKLAAQVIRDGLDRDELLFSDGIGSLPAGSPGTHAPSKSSKGGSTLRVVAGLGLGTAGLYGLYRWVNR